MCSAFLPQEVLTWDGKKMVKLNVIWDHTEDVPSFPNISGLFQKELKYAVTLPTDIFTSNMNTPTPS